MPYQNHRAAASHRPPQGVEADSPRRAPLPAAARLPAPGDIMARSPSPSMPAGCAGVRSPGCAPAVGGAALGRGHAAPGLRRGTVARSASSTPWDDRDQSTVAQVPAAAPLPGCAGAPPNGAKPWLRSLLPQTGVAPFSVWYPGGGEIVPRSCRRCALPVARVSAKGRLTRPVMVGAGRHWAGGVRRASLICPFSSTPSVTQPRRKHAS